MQRLRRVGETSGAFARVLLPEKLLIHTERCEMRRDLCVFAEFVLPRPPRAPMTKAPPPRPGNPPPKKTPVPRPHHPPHHRQRTQRRGEQHPAQKEGARATPAHPPPIAEEKASLTHH